MFAERPKLYMDNRYNEVTLQFAIDDGLYSDLVVDIKLVAEP